MKLRYSRPFISLLPSVIRKGRTLTPENCSSFQFHLVQDWLENDSNNTRSRKSMQRIIDAHKNLTALSKRQDQQMNIF